MKFSKVIKIIFCLMFLVQTFSNVFGKTIWCNPVNSGTENGLTKSTGYNTLWKAISAMASGDIVIIANGDWRNTANMYINASHKPPDGSSQAYSTIRAESDWEVKLPYIHIETLSSTTQGYLEFRGIVFDNKYIGTGNGHVQYHMHHTKFIRCGFLAHGLEGNNHACGFGNADPDRSKNQYNLMEECVVWGSGRYMLYSKYGQYNIFRRCIVRHDYNAQGADQMFNFRAYACDYHIYQNCISFDSDRIQFYSSPLNGESGGFWPGDQYGATGNELHGCISIKDIQMSYYICGNGDGNAIMKDCVALDITVPGYTTLSAFILKSNTNLIASNILGFGALSEGQDGFYGKKSGDFVIKNSILKDIAEYGIGSVSNSYVNHFNADAILWADWGVGTTTYDPEINGLLYPVRIEKGSALATAGEGGTVCGPTIIKKIGVSGTLYGEDGWKTVIDENLWPFPSEDKIQEIMRYTVDGVSGWYGFCAGPGSLTDYIWGYLGNAPPDFYPPKPRWGNVIPSPDSSDIPLNASIIIPVYDNGTGVDFTSIILAVENDTVFDGQNPQLFPNTVISGNSSEYIITYDSPVNFSLGQQVKVSVTAQDLADPPNIMNRESYSFATVNSDTSPPYCLCYSPENGAVNIAIDTNIVIHIMDDGTGVDSSSIQISVLEEIVYDGSYPDQFPNIFISGNALHYIITYNPSGNFDYNQNVDIQVNAQDLTNPANTMSAELFSFVTIQPSIINTDNISFVQSYHLCQNYPNPFNPGTTIEYHLKSQGNVNLVIYSMSGQVVKTLVRDNLSQGKHQIYWAGDDDIGENVSSGVYFCQLKTDLFKSTKKMIKLE